MEKWAIGLLALLLGGHAAVRSFERGVADDFRSKLIDRKGRIDFHVRPPLPFGYLDGDLGTATLSGSDFASDGMPVLTQPEYSHAGRIGDLRLRFTDLTMTGLRVRRLDADILACRYDRALAVTKKRIRLTHSGTGSVRIEVTADALADFAMRKYPMLTKVVVRLSGGRFQASGNVSLLGTTDFAVAGSLGSPDGSRLFVEDAEVAIGGRKLSAESSKAFLQRLNPIIDQDKDLHLLDTLRIRKLTLDNDLLIAEGEATIPVAPAHKDGK